MSLTDSRIECLRGRSAILNLRTVRVVALEYSQLHKKAYNFLVCEFEGFESALRGWSRTGHPYIASTGAMIRVIQHEGRGQEAQYSMHEAQPHAVFICVHFENNHVITTLRGPTCYSSL